MKTTIEESYGVLYKTPRSSLRYDYVNPNNRRHVRRSMGKVQALEEMVLISFCQREPIAVMFLESLLEELRTRITDE